MTRTKTETRTLQVWPSGKGFEYRGDVDGPENQRSLRPYSYNGGTPERWRKGTADEWRQIRLTVRAQMYADRDVLCCDSALVDDLLKGSDLGEGFSYDELRNVYADPSDWDADQCREYASDHGLDLPSNVRHTSCAHCDADIEGVIDGTDDGRWLDRGGNWHCPIETAGDRTSQKHEPADLESEQDDWLKEAVEACEEHTRDNPAEVLEWWRVSSWLCDKLHTIGEVTIDNGYGHWWGRQCSGQGYLMDGTLQKVAALFEQKGPA